MFFKPMHIAHGAL